MATQFAASPGVYESVSRANRQRRASGRIEDKNSGYTAYRAALDASSAKALEARRLSINEDVENRRLAMQEEAYGDQALAGMVSGGVSLAQTGIYAYDKFKGVKPATAEVSGSPAQGQAMTNIPAVMRSATPSLGTEPLGMSMAPSEFGMSMEPTEFGMTMGEPAVGGQAIATKAIAGGGVAGSEIGGAAMAGEADVAGLAAAESGMSAGTIGAGPAAAGVIGVELLKDPISDWAQDTFGGEAGEIVNVAGRATQGGLAGAVVGGPVGAAVGAAVGTVVGVVEAVTDSHICTATHNALGLRDGVLIAMKTLKKYAFKHHKKEISYYIKNCQLAIEKADNDYLLKYMTEFKQNTSEEVATLIENGEMEKAFEVYMGKAEELFLDYDPDYKKGMFAEKK
jgi:hypothetical protein